MLSVSEISATWKTTRKVLSLIRILLCAPIDKLRRRVGGHTHARVEQRRALGLGRTLCASNSRE